LKLSLEITKWN